MKLLLSILLTIVCVEFGRATLTEDLSVLSAAVDELKAEEKAASKAFHDELSNKIEANIGKIGENIKNAINSFNASKDINILKDARDNFVTGLINGISKAKEAKEQFKQQKTAEVQQTIADLATILTAAREELAAASSVQAVPKDLSAAIARVSGASSWQTASWLLILLCIILGSAVAVLFIKQIKGNGAYQRLGGASGGGAMGGTRPSGSVFVPSQQYKTA